MVGPGPATPPREVRLAPLRWRLAIYALLVALAIASIWLIDRRAMTTMNELTENHPASARVAP
ncbi:MAG: hypothetical protein ACLFV3_10650 [Phycisphaeraceae bacterium]